MGGLYSSILSFTTSLSHTRNYRVQRTRFVEFAQLHTTLTFILQLWTKGLRNNFIILMEKKNSGMIYCRARFMELATA